MVSAVSDTIYVAMISAVDREHKPVTSTCGLLGLYRSHEQAVARAAQFVRHVSESEPADWVQSDDDLLEWFNCTQVDYTVDVQPSAIQQEVRA